MFLRSASQKATELATSLQTENSPIPGVFYFRIETRTGDDDETKCRKWVTFQEDNVKSLITSSLLPSCPCSRVQADFDSRFFLSDRFTNDPCFNSTVEIPIAGNLFSGDLLQTCCYNPAGALIVDDVDAGNVVFENTTLLDDVLDDFAAKQVCCSNSQNCGKFKSVRPTDDCTEYSVLIRSK